MRRPGFSLNEILIVIGVLILLAGGGIAFSFPYLQRSQLRAAGTLALAEVRQAQAEAHAQKNDAGHGVKVFADRLVRFEGTSYAARNASQDVSTAFPTPVDAVAAPDEADFPAGSLKPAAEAILRMERGDRYYQITVSTYGVLSVQEGTIAP